MNTEIIEKHHPLFNKLSFVLQARSDDDRLGVARSMHLLHIEDITDDGDTKAICTDGRRLHIFTGETLLPGNYQVLTHNKKQIILSPTTDYKFPDWRKVMPDKGDYKKVDERLDLNSASLKKNQLNKLSQKYFAFIKQTDCLVDLKYFSALSGHEWEVFYSAPDKSILFENNELTALIMPMAQV